jgi:hypothetical protein
LLVCLFITLFLESGFGWGWPATKDQSFLRPLILTGVGFGLSYIVFAWLATGRFRSHFAITLLCTNILFAVLPDGYQVFQVGGLVLTNFFFTQTWIRARNDKGI